MGIALTEALIALTVLASSLAATAAVTIQSIRHTREASARSAAVRIASSVAEDLRAFRCPDDSALQAVSGLSPDAACALHPSCCAMERKALAQFEARQSELTGSLPAGAVLRVEVVDPLDSAYRVTVVWAVLGASDTASLVLPVES
jgi:Tfp pilus assembly protein PilV